MKSLSTYCTLPFQLAFGTILLATVLPAQPISSSDFDIRGEDTGCAGVSLCGDAGDSIYTAGDVNGDGILDLAMGAPTVSGANPSTGRVYIFYGPFEDDLRAEQADVTVTGLEFGDLVGTVRSGDLDGDGVSDLVIGSRGPDIDGGILNGQVWVFYGPLAGDFLTSDADAILTGTSFSELGRSVAVGDFNGDGRDDILAGASQSLSGRAHLFYGPVFGEHDAGEADAIVSGTIGFEELGESVAAVDLNGDGVDDLAIGAPNFPLGEISAGAAYVFFGPLFGEVTSLAADVTIEGEDLNDDFGSHMANGGDVDGDGFEDLVVGAWQLFNDGPGKAYLFRGPFAPGTRQAADADAILLGEPGDGNDLFGILTGAGDVNGDGFDDVLVGAQFAGAQPLGRGRAYLFEGPLSGTIPASDADWIFEAPGFDPGGGLDAFGRGVGPADDLDGNGFSDFLIGGPGSDGPGFARLVLAPGLEITVDPEGSLVIPAGGGDLTFEVTLTNTSTAIRRVDAWLLGTAEGGDPVLLRGPVERTLDPTSGETVTLTIAVPASLPAGTYDLTVATGAFPTPAASDGFMFQKAAAADGGGL